MGNQSNDFSFNREFCEHLEYHLGRTFANSSDNTIQGLWCDGIDFEPIPISQLSRKHVNDKRQIITKACIGYDGQGDYKMTIIFGKYSLRRYAKGISLIDCIPGEESMDWIDLDVEGKRILINLN